VPHAAQEVELANREGASSWSEFLLGLKQVGLSARQNIRDAIGHGSAATASLSVQLAARVIR